MRAIEAEHWPEQQIVQRRFTIRWTRGCAYTRLHGRLGDESRHDIEVWAATLDEVIPQLGGDFVTVLDTTALGEIPRSLWLDLAKLAHGMIRKPLRRALIAAEGWIGDNQAQAASLATAGNVRVFEPDELDEVIAWASAAGTIDADRLRRFLR